MINDDYFTLQNIRWLLFKFVDFPHCSYPILIKAIL